MGLCLLSGWLAWFALGSVTVDETSRSARLEVRQRPHPVATVFAGRVATSALSIGQEVASGDVLVALDASAERLRLIEKQTRLAGIPPRLASMRHELISLDAARAEDQQAGQGRRKPRKRAAGKPRPRSNSPATTNTA